MATPSFVRVADTELVFRLPKEDVFPADTDTPTEAAFFASSEDKVEGNRLNRRVAISVWDARLTTTEQAIGARDPALRLRRCDLPVNELHRLDGVQVIRWEIDGPGGDGHCGIEGLHTAIKADKPRVSNLRRLVCEIAAKAAKR